jgi:hypothetical protein
MESGLRIHSASRRACWVLACATLALLVSALAVTPSWALGPYSRHGLAVGVGLGIGGGTSTDGEGNEIPFQDGATPQIRIGGMLNPHWMLHFEFEEWLIEKGDVHQKQRTSLQNFAAAATFFPGKPDTPAGGIFLRAGIGIASCRAATVDLNEKLEQVNPQATDESGLGLLFGGGYDFPIARGFTAGVSVTANYLTIGQQAFDTAWFLPVAMTLTWYH